MGGIKKVKYIFLQRPASTLGGYYFNKFLLESTLYVAFFFTKQKRGQERKTKKVLENAYACSVRDGGGKMYVSIYT